MTDPDSERLRDQALAISNILAKSGIGPCTLPEGVRQLWIERDTLRDELAAIKAKEPPLLQCADCKNTESCAGAMARQFNHGRCMFCGGYFKVVRA